MTNSEAGPSGSPPPPKRPEVTNTNCALQLNYELYDAELAVIVAFLLQCPLRHALTAISDVPLETVLDAFTHTEVDKVTRNITLSFRDAQGIRHTITVTRELFGTILQLPQSDAPVPSSDELSHFICDLAQIPRFRGMTVKHSISQLPSLWHFLASVITRAFFGQTGTKVEGYKDLWRTLYGLYHNVALDFLHILWEDFTRYLQRNKDSCRHPRWLALIINHFLQSLPMASRIYDSNRPPHGLISHMKLSHSHHTTHPMVVPDHIERCLPSDSPYYQAYINHRDNGASSSSSQPTKRKSSTTKEPKQKKIQEDYSNNPSSSLRTGTTCGDGSTHSAFFIR